MSFGEMSQLTAELERLEQSITLTLQEIDYNFSKCHQIITANILPRIEKYSDSSKEIWDSSRFWKQFFEESAHVSFSSYEEPATTVEEASARSGRSSPINEQESTFLGLSNVVDESTPGKKKTKWADIVSPFEQLQREMSQYKELTPLTITTDETSTRDMVTPVRLVSTRKQDPLLHRVLDSNWRLKATPFERVTQSPCSSPIEPRLHSVLFTPKKTAQDESDSEEIEAMMSPPVTMQFSVPQSRLLRTPAREVANRLVDDILKTAGGYSSEFDSEKMDSGLYFAVEGTGSPIRRR